ncbi:hypothetical protein JQ617_01885 [Bradyrhizobium sp. KB893862 SZCCT0404]|uniref:hypothetical protein n=1 Tax=Bradyrhizobium sp. KB893862 SZCCT0404 TaxID=2807672 RepID=UPI001BA464EF|nr:hypothetical protein [Bradyrhizobium sp. KB893862 SZCCT0404]MBR1172693.1 hypothetical protein [Bradyrhizobium sp. KB893862 SZCCT0404]
MEADLKNYDDEQSDPARRHGSGRPRVLSYWRSIPAEEFDDAFKSEVTAFVRGTTTTIPEWRRAIAGDTVAAIAMVIDCKAPDTIGIKVDFAMTVLLACAFDDPAAALVLSVKLRQMPLPARLRKQLATSWLVANMLSCLKRSAPTCGGHGT